jgi:hypothetical protein
MNLKIMSLQKELAHRENQLLTAQTEKDINWLNATIAHLRDLLKNEMPLPEKPVNWLAQNAKPKVNNTIWNEWMDSETTDLVPLRIRLIVYRTNYAREQLVGMIKTLANHQETPKLQKKKVDCEWLLFMACN